MDENLWRFRDSGALIICNIFAGKPASGDAFGPPSRWSSRRPACCGSSGHLTVRYPLCHRSPYVLPYDLAGSAARRTYSAFAAAKLPSSPARDRCYQRGHVADPLLGISDAGRMWSWDPLDRPGPGPTT